MALPARCDVAVLGGGLAGLLTAERLQRAGASVVLLDGERPSASARSLGAVALGWIDSPARLTLGLGEDLARALCAWSALAVESLFATCARLGVSHQRTGSWRLCLDERERREWDDSRALLRRWGLGGALGERPAGDGDHGAIGVGADGLVDVPGLMGALRRAFEAAGGQRLALDGVLAEEAGAPTVTTRAGVLRAELTVVAAGAHAVSAHPFFRTTVVPVRVQGQRVQAPPTADPRPVLARHRFEAWTREGSSLSFVGCRWAEQPEMEAGVTDDSSLSERVWRAQDRFLAERLGVPEDADRERWAGIVAHTCDGLPLVGPLPGAPKVIGLVGWSGWGLSLFARAVDEVTAAMLGEPPPGGATTPGLITARRMV